MTALWTALAVIGYATIAAVVMRGFAWDAQRRGTRDRELARNGIVGEVAPGLVWPIVLPILAVGGLLYGLHALATKGIGKKAR